jgi:hypothetical protein
MKQEHSAYQKSVSKLREIKGADSWVDTLSDAGNGHSCTCICERCKKGQEVFLLPVDIEQIQINALNWAMKHSPEQIEEMVKMISK